MARDLTGKRILIVGATGVLGSELAAQLSSAGATVCAIVRDASALNTATVSQPVLSHNNRWPVWLRIALPKLVFGEQ